MSGRNAGRLGGHYEIVNDAPSLPVADSVARGARPSVAVVLGGGEIDALLCVRCGDPRLRWLSPPNRQGSKGAAREVRTAELHDMATAWATCGRCGTTSVWHGTALVFPALTMPELVQYQLRMALHALAGATYEDADHTSEVAALRARRDTLRRFRLRALRYAPPLGPTGQSGRSPWATAEDALVMALAAGEERELDQLIAGARDASRELMAHLREAVTTCWRQACALGVSLPSGEPATGGEGRVVRGASGDGAASAFV